MHKYLPLITITTTFISIINAIDSNKIFSIYNAFTNITTEQSLMETFLNGIFFLDSKLNLTTLMSNPHFDKCFASLVNPNTSELNPEVKSNTLLAFDACGKYLSDYGFSEDCLLNDAFEFFLLNYTLSISDFNTTSQYQIMRFMNQENFFTGFCMFKDCMDILQIIFNSTESKAFTDFLKQEAGIKNLTLIRNNNITKTPVMFIIMTIIFYLIVIGSLIICIIRLSCFFSFRWKYLQFLKQNEIDDEQQSQSDSIISDDSQQQTKSKSNNNNSNSNKHVNLTEVDILNRSKRIFEEELKRKNSFRNNIIERIGTFIVKYGSSVDPFQNFYNLVTRKNYWYNDSNLEFISFLRSCVNLGLSLFYNFLIIRQIPPKDLFNKSFYTQPTLYIIKIASYSHVCWVILDGIVMSFKLLNMIKDYFNTNCDKTVTLPFMVKYFSLVIPKMITFVIMYIYFYSFVLNFKSYIPSISLFYNNINSTNSNNTDLLSIYWKSITKPGPLFFSGDVNHFNIIKPYISFNNSYLINECDDTVINGDDRHNSISWPIHIVLVAQIMVNEFYCFIIYLIILYIAFKLRKHIYDKLIQVIIISLSIILCVYFNNQLTNDSNSFNPACYIYFLGNMNHDYNFCYTLYYYGLGVLLGICFFYYQDIKNNYSSIQIGNYIPFQLCKTIVRQIISFSRKQYYFIKTSILLLCVLLMFVGVTTPAYCYITNGIEGNDVSTCNYMNVFYTWEKVFISYLFAIVFLLMMVFIKGTVLEYLCQPTLSLFVERISSIYFLLIPWFIVFAYSVFLFQYSLSFQNLSFVAIGLNIFAVVVCVCLYLFIEIFLRKILKYKFIRASNWEKFHKQRAIIEDELSLNEADSFHED